MFFSIEQIKVALKKLESVHAFFGLTFLALKKNGLRVGSAIEFPINAEDKKFLDEYYAPAPESKWYYRVFRTSDKNKHWLEPKYPSSGLQAIRTQTFGDAFIHPKGTDIWGWVPDYVAKLKAKLPRGKPIPAFYLAVWLYRERDWPSNTSAEDVINTFFADFLITEEEKRELFDVSVPKSLDLASLFQDTKITWQELLEVIGPPPDAPQEEGGTLAYLELQGVGPAKKIEFSPGERLNLITGDNGLGKTFLLECAWWALTGQWPSFPAYPRNDARPNEAKIIFEIAGEAKKSEKITILYDWQVQNWPSPQGRPTIPGLVIYARVDGSFTVWDLGRIEGIGSTAPHLLSFSKDEVWNGLSENFRGQIRFYSDGLIRDWVNWQSRPGDDDSPFNTFKKVLHRLSPREMRPLEPGKPRRLPGDVRLIPTLRHPYGEEVPIVYAAAGIQRIVAMTYLIVWSWWEHKTLSEEQHKDPQKRIVVLVDEMEAHLHPKWQRVILPALLDVSKDLSSGLQIQFIIATHSPLVMASVEPIFDFNRDKLFHLDLIPGTLFESEVQLEEIPFIRYGPVDSWLMSEVFELTQTRSVEAEEAIERARELQLAEDPNVEEIRAISEALKKLLAVDDEFWPLWKYFAEEHGVWI